MKKELKIILPLILIGFLIVIFIKGVDLPFMENKKTNNEKSDIAQEIKGLEENMIEFYEDIYFYKGMNAYLSLLKEEQFQYIEDLMTQKEKGEKIEDLFVLLVVHEILQDEKAKEIMMTLKSEVQSFQNKELSKEDEQDLFEKNNSCALLVKDIKEQLSNKYRKDTSGGFVSYSTEKEELDFIFYSPTKKACLYSTTYTYDYDDYPDNYTKTEKKVYNAFTQQKEESFKYYAYKYEHWDDEDIQKDKRAYIKFILENSNYNADLIGNISLY